MGRTTKSRSPRVEALKVEGLQATVQVRRHPTARRMTLRVSRTKHAVLMTVPLQCSLADAGNFLHTHLDWVRQHLGAVPAPISLDGGEILPFRGKPHRIVFTGARDADFLVRVEEAAGNGMPRLVVSGTAAGAPRRLANWLAAQASTDLEARVRFHAQRLGVKPKKIVVRDQVTRWGSCSTTGVLSYSWRLILAPGFVLDYLAAHEAAHLVEMNHSRAFWRQVERICPEFKRAKAWLDAHGADLHRYGMS